MFRHFCIIQCQDKDVLLVDANANEVGNSWNNGAGPVFILCFNFSLLLNGNNSHSLCITKCLNDELLVTCSCKFSLSLNVCLLCVHIYFVSYVFESV